MDCCNGPNPYLACSEKLLQMQRYTGADYKEDIRALQTATSTWYLSIQSQYDADTGATRTHCSEQFSPDSSTCTTPDGISKSSFLCVTPSVSAAGQHLKQEQSLHQAQCNAATQGAESSSSEGCTTPTAHDSYHPSLMDVQPSIFQTCRSPPPSTASPARRSPALRSSCSRETTTPEQQPSSVEEASTSLGDTGLPFSMAALGPSVENLLQHSKCSTELSPAAARVELSSCGEQHLSRDSDSRAPSAEPEGLASELEVQEQSGTKSNAMFSTQAPWQQKAVQWQVATGAAGAGSGAKKTCSSTMNSCIPAFHQEAMGNDCSPPYHDPTASPPECLAFLDESLPVLMPTLHSAFSPNGNCLIDTNTSHLELRDTSSCGAMPDVEREGNEEEGEEQPDVQEAESSPARLVADTAGRNSEDLDTFTLRRVCSLIPQRGAMLTPASECLGADMLTEVPALLTYKNRPPRRQPLHQHTSVTFVDNPTVNVFEDGQDTAFMTVSAAPVLRQTSDDTKHAKHTRKSSPYLCMRDALTLQGPCSHPGEGTEQPAMCPISATESESSAQTAQLQFRPGTSAADTDAQIASHSSLGHLLAGVRDRLQPRLMSHERVAAGSDKRFTSSEMSHLCNNTLTSSDLQQVVADLHADVPASSAAGMASCQESSIGSVTMDHVQHCNNSSSNSSVPGLPMNTVEDQNCSRSCGLVASLEVICQALVDSKNLLVHTELGCKLSSPPSWMEVVTLLLCSLNRPHLSAAEPLSESEICEICQQIAYIFLPVGSAITAMQMHLMCYLETTGAVRSRTTSESTLPVTQAAPLSRQATDMLQQSTLTGGYCGSSPQTYLLSGRPRDFLTTLLPQVMFDYVACLLNIGMRMDEIARQHNIKELKALDILKQQVAFVLGELTDLSSTTVSAVMSLCQGQAPYVPGQLDCLSSFLVASLDHMTASVSLMHGRLPLNESDEALQEIAQTDHAWQRARSASTAFFHCLSVCGHVLQILEQVTSDMQSWRKGGAVWCISPRALKPEGNCTPQSKDTGISASVLATLPGVASAVPWQHIGQDWKVLLETMPKVQATGCRLVMLVGSIIKSISDDAHAEMCRMATLPDTQFQQGRTVRCSSPGPVPPQLSTLGSSASRAHSMALPSPLRLSRSVRAMSCSRAFGERNVSTAQLHGGGHRRGSPMALHESLSIVLPAGSDRSSWDGTSGSQTPPTTPPAAQIAPKQPPGQARKLFISPCYLPRIHDTDTAEEEQDSPPPSPPVLSGPFLCGDDLSALAPIKTPSHTSTGMFDSVMSNSPTKTPRSLTPPPGLSKLQIHRPNEICGTPHGDSFLGSPQISPFVCPPPGSPMSALSPAIGKHGLTFRSLLDASSPTLVIEEPLLEIGPLSGKDRPMSPIARPMVRRRLALPHSADRSTTLLDLDNERECPSLSDNPLQRHRRAVSMSLSHIQTAVPSSLCMTSSAAGKHSLRKNSSNSSKCASATSSQSRQAMDASAKLPAALTVQEVSQVQSALARSIAALGTELVDFLQARCKKIVDSVSTQDSTADPSCKDGDCDQYGSITANIVPSTGAELDACAEGQMLSTPLMATILARCERAAPAQLSICHNLRRWAQVLCAAESMDSETFTFASVSQQPGRVSAEISADGQCSKENSKDTCCQMCDALEESAEVLRATALAGQKCIDVAAVCEPGNEAPLELLLGSAIKPLGSKSLGSVWMHHLGADYVAVKWVKIEDDPLNRGYTAIQKQNMVIHEVEALLSLKHPNIVQFLGIASMHTPSSTHPQILSEQFDSSDSDDSCPTSPTDSMKKPTVHKNLPSVGIVLELCHFGTLQDFLNQTRALFNNSSRLYASPHGFQVRSGTCSSALEGMCLCFINSWSQRLRLGKEIALALAACHASGVLHRDVTSFNVMLSEMHEGNEAAAEHALRWHEVNDDGDVLEVWSLPWATRLIDFGLSKNGVARGGGDPATASIDMHSLPWMAPEIIQGSQHLQSGDVYGLGMVLWELLTTHKPPVRTLPSFVAGGKDGSGSQDTAGPCEPALLEMQRLESQGRTADLMRKLHGVPCPVLSEIFDVIQATQCCDPHDRISAAEVAQRLADLEVKCQSQPVEPSFMDDDVLARYWRESGSVREEELTPFSDLTPFSSSSTL